ncbi:carboxypeptidase M32 [Akkermansiaceae bacterium]|nr:carboxypeptidase M32 [Akkermansiaceae bacterium]
MSYEKLCGIHEEIALLSSTQATLSWDQETFLPAKAVPYRSKQLSYLATKIHQLSTSADYADALKKAEDTAGDDVIVQANIREWRHDFERGSQLPETLVQRDTEACSAAMPFWKEARDTNDFSLFAPKLTELLEIAKEKADRWGYEDEVYTALLSNYERGATTTHVSELFDTCSADLISMAKQATDRSAATPCRPLTGVFSVGKQQELNRLVAQSIGFDFSRGRIDTTTHPFCSELAPEDVRLTTRYDETNFLSSLYGVMHEAGHGMYEQGLNADQYGRPAGKSVSLGIHESQSRLWENHVGRSREFWEKWLPTAADIFPQLSDWTVDEIFQHVNSAKYSMIRVDADDATYDLHILLRFRIERMMINGEVAVKDIPELWNSLFEEYFGMKPASDADGCLQDVHWSFGLFGYFCTYSLGNFNASQLMHSAQQHSDVQQGLDNANYQPLLKWMQQNVHQQGSILIPQDLMLQATGSVTKPEHHLAHLKSRFLS